MQENVQKEEGGISLLEILRLLLSKIKILFLVVVAVRSGFGIRGTICTSVRKWNST